MPAIKPTYSMPICVYVYMLYAILYVIVLNPTFVLYHILASSPIHIAQVGFCAGTALEGMCVCVCMCECVCICVCMYVCMYVCLYVLTNYTNNAYILHL
jgi:hypothetical protein